MVLKYVVDLYLFFCTLMHSVTNLQDVTVWLSLSPFCGPGSQCFFYKLIFFILICYCGFVYHFIYMWMDCFYCIGKWILKRLGDNSTCKIVYVKKFLYFFQTI